MMGDCLMFHRYFLRVTVVRRLSDIVKEKELIVHTLSSYPEMNSSIKMEVGIEDCLHIEFEYNKSKYHLKDVIVGKIYFLLVRIKIKHMEIAIIKRETTGSGNSHSIFHSYTLSFLRMLVSFVHYNKTFQFPAQGQIHSMKMKQSQSTKSWMVHLFEVRAFQYACSSPDTSSCQQWRTSIRSFLSDIISTLFLWMRRIVVILNNR